MTYQETLDWMFSRLPMYQREGKTAFKKDLTNILAFSEYLGQPELKFKSIHVGGTNGKGSTSHMLASVLQEAGYKVGLYTSPHLKSFTERIRINGQEVTEDFVIAFIEKYKDFLEQQGLSFFEMTVGMAFAYFASEDVDIAVIEVGLGGRLDSTNIITPEVSVITNIGYDHMQFLGNSLSEIASEKAGIIKHNTPVVIGEYQEEVAKIFIDKAKEQCSKLTFASESINNYQTDLLGTYQKHNIKTAVTALKHLKSFDISEEHIKRGLLNVVKNTNLRGRWQVLSEHPKMICDTGHNKEGLSYVLKQLESEIYDSLHIVLGAVSDKDLRTILPLFPKNAHYYFCKPAIARGLCEKKLKTIASSYNLVGDSFNSVNQAIEEAKVRAKPSDLIFIGGSTFVVAEIF